MTKDEFEELYCNEVSYTDFYPLMQQLKRMLNTYVFEMDQVNDVYHVACRFIEEVNLRAYTDLKTREKMYNWILKGGTLLLMQLLTTNTCYDDDDIRHFNAMTLLDTVNCKLKGYE